tara:strand:- start:1380 stop:2090 length:711 start_codon:yes stop_codon:yes gene_type:complete
MNIKELLIDITKKVISNNNEPLEKNNFEEKGISNHIYNERGVQLRIGFELFNELNLKGNIEFEKLYHNIEKGRKEKTDIYFFYNGLKIGIELKFKTWGLRKKDNSADYNARKNKGYYFEWQGARPNGRHDFYYDIHRLNNLIDKKIIDIGYQIFITNDKNYFKKVKDSNKSNSFKFSMDENIKIPEYLPAPTWKNDNKENLILNYAKGERIKWIHDTKGAMNDLPQFSFVIIELKN